MVILSNYRQETCVVRLILNGMLIFLYKTKQYFRKMEHIGLLTESSFKQKEENVKQKESSLNKMERKVIGEKAIDYKKENS
jgi:hypoxanthine-guanine phosphoribosyltransferase